MTPPAAPYTVTRQHGTVVTSVHADFDLACSFSLLCAYPTTAFDRVESTALFRVLCEQHSSVNVSGGQVRPTR